MIRRNVLANAVGQVWAAVMGLIAVPIYIHFLGVEAYGLVAFFASLQALLSVLDLGLGTTANREVARRLPHPEKADETQDLVRTLEVIYVVIGVVIAVVIVASAAWFIDSWISEASISRSTLRLAVVVFGISLGVRWPVSLYAGVLMGTERQVRLNAASIAIATLRTVGAILVLALISASLVAFLLWYLVANAVELAVMATMAWSALPKGTRPAAPTPGLLRGIWRFSASISGNSLLATFLKQSDRLLITKLLPLRFLGYYAAANAAGSGLSMLARPVATAALPRFTALLAKGENSRLGESYHRLSQAVAVVVAPVGTILIFFAEDILRLWTRSPDIATNAATTFAVFGFANLLNALMQVPFALQLAAGITWIAIMNNAISVVLLLPFMYLLIQRFGIAGAGLCWAIFNTIYFLLIPHVMHRYVLPGHARQWFLRDTLPFIFVALPIGAAMRVVRDSGARPLLFGLSAIAGALLYGVVAVALSDVVRSTFRDLFGKGNTAVPNTPAVLDLNITRNKP